MDVISTEGSEEASRWGPEGADGVPVVPGAGEVCRLTGAEGTALLGSLPFWVECRRCISKSNEKILLGYKQQLG